MMADFSPIRRVLMDCRRAGMRVTVWWRDDDAVEPTPALERLQALARSAGLPVHIAAIPAHVAPQLPGALDAEVTRVLVHGWAHDNRAPQDHKKSEFGQPHAGDAALLQDALYRMQKRFGARLDPVFVPPWNRIAPQTARVLPALGYEALSTIGPRNDRFSVNTHIDPIEWRGTRDLVDPGHLVAQTAAHLSARARAEEDAFEPLGLLTHHLVHSPRIWEFAERWLSVLLEGGALPWRFTKGNPDDEPT